MSLSFCIYVGSLCYRDLRVCLSSRALPVMYCAKLLKGHRNNLIPKKAAKCVPVPQAKYIYKERVGGVEENPYESSVVLILYVIYCIYHVPNSIVLS